MTSHKWRTPHHRRADLREAASSPNRAGIDDDHGNNRRPDTLSAGRQGLAQNKRLTFG
jgi:hypothetical protein